MSKNPLQIAEPYPSQLDLIIADVLRELELASAKHPAFPSARHGHSVIEEEYVEFFEAVRHDDLNHAREEATQLCAMCIRFLLDCE